METAKRAADTRSGGVLDTVHGGWVHQRRVRVLSHHLAALVPTRVSVLDVGCGDGLIGSILAELRPDLEVSGMEIAVRGDARIPIRRFDGHTIPLPDASVDAVMLVDVLHHAADPLGLLREANRVARRTLVIKDVTTVGPLAGPVLSLMDWVGNARHGVPLPYNFWSQRQWRQAFAEIGLGVEATRRRLELYPWPWTLVFERRMHFVVRLVRAKARPA